MFSGFLYVLKNNVLNAIIGFAESGIMCFPGEDTRMKKLLCIVAALVMLMSFAACSGDIGANDEIMDDLSQIAGEILDEALSDESGGEYEKSEAAAAAVPHELPEEQDDEPGIIDEAIDEDGTYTAKEDVALYIHTYGRLPENFISKSDAQKLGWEGGSLEPYAPGMCIGGSRFGNYEGLLPEKDGREYTECDIDTLGAEKRGAKRIVFSNDGLIYYTDDHYESFELLYGEE